MWCDDFDMDLPRVVPKAMEVIAPVADLRLYTYGGTFDDALNHPSCWNHRVGLIAFFGLTPEVIKPASYYTNHEVVECTIADLVRDAWPHGYRAYLYRGDETDAVEIWDAQRLQRRFNTIMYDLRGWQADEEAAENARAHVWVTLQSMSAFLLSRILWDDLAQQTLAVRHGRLVQNVPFGTRREGARLIEFQRGVLFAELSGEMFTVVGHPTVDAKPGDVGAMVFTQGGPSGGYWHFEAAS